eukprot:GFYU01012323.1.p1 GENE.GFYU01012323.1~~GFYU01012323.1.p1  ORF type:complete len:564 (+),score=56.93 GFYU01012323.1:125-1816(+)
MSRLIFTTAVVLCLVGLVTGERLRNVSGLRRRENVERSLDSFELSQIPYAEESGDDSGPSTQQDSRGVGTYLKDKAHRLKAKVKHEDSIVHPAPQPHTRPVSHYPPRVPPPSHSERPKTGQSLSPPAVSARPPRPNADHTAATPAERPNYHRKSVAIIIASSSESSTSIKTKNDVAAWRRFFMDELKYPADRVITFAHDVDRSGDASLDDHSFDYTRDRVSLSTVASVMAGHNPCQSRGIRVGSCSGKVALDDVRYLYFVIATHGACSREESKIQFGADRHLAGGADLASLVPPAVRKVFFAADACHSERLSGAFFAALPDTTRFVGLTSADFALPTYDSGISQNGGTFSSRAISQLEFSIKHRRDTWQEMFQRLELQSKEDSRTKKMMSAAEQRDRRKWRTTPHMDLRNVHKTSEVSKFFIVKPPTQITEGYEVKPPRKPVFTEGYEVKPHRKPVITEGFEVRPQRPHITEGFEVRPQTHRPEVQTADVVWEDVDDDSDEFVGTPFTEVLDVVWHDMDDSEDGWETVPTPNLAHPSRPPPRPQYYNPHQAPKPTTINGEVFY